MKELLIFLLVIFFIESKTIGTPILRPNNGAVVIPKKDPTFDDLFVKPTKTNIFCEGVK